MIIKGKNDYWVAVWDCLRQSYYLYYKNRFFTEKFKIDDLKSYLG
jgi:hypothetical protein